MIFLVIISWLISVFCLFVFVPSVFNTPSFQLKYQICQEQRLFYSLLYLNVDANSWHFVGAPQIYAGRIMILSYKTGVPNLQAKDQYWPRPVRNQATQQEVSLDVMLLNYPKIIPSPHLWKSCLPGNRSLVLKRLGTTDIKCTLLRSTYITNA